MTSKLKNKASLLEASARPVHAFESEVLYVVASGSLDVSMRDALATLDATALETL